MRIGFDAKRLFNNTTGLGNYARTLVRDLATYFPDHEYHLFVQSLKQSANAESFLKEPRFVVHTPSILRTPLWRRWGISRDIESSNLTIYHGLSAELPFGLNSREVRTVVTIHDLIHRIAPEDYSLVDRTVYELKYRDACLRADSIVTISACTKNDVVNHYGIPKSKIHVVYPTCDKSFYAQVPRDRIESMRARFSLPTDFILSVGTIIKRKNLLAVIAALRTLSSDVRPPLVVVGRGSAYAEEVMRQVQAWGLEKSVIFRPGIPFAELPALYQSCKLFIYPSFYEGFGIPILEALASGAPVITSNRSCLPEAGGKAAALVDPSKPEEIADRISNIMGSEELRQKMIAEGKRHAQIFNAEQVTRDLMRIYTSLAN